MADRKDFFTDRKVIITVPLTQDGKFDFGKLNENQIKELTRAAQWVARRGNTIGFIQPSGQNPLFDEMLKKGVTAVAVAPKGIQIPTTPLAGNNNGWTRES